MIDPVHDAIFAFLARFSPGLSQTKLDWDFDHVHVMKWSNKSCQAVPMDESGTREEAVNISPIVCLADVSSTASKHLCVDVRSFEYIHIYIY
jgi:hypothetical protein